MAKKSIVVPERELRICSLPESWRHILDLMKMGNAGNPGAAILADLALNRYFERIDEAAISAEIGPF